MEDRHYYHLCADGDDALNYIISKDDFVAAVNLVGVCAANTGADVVCFTIEDTHPHFLLYGRYSECLRFRDIYSSSYLGHVIQSRGNKDDVILDIEIIEVKDDDYLKNVGAYVIVQPTKDGKQVMPYDYPWGSGCLYFRTGQSIPVWLVDDSGRLSEPIRIGDMTLRQKRSVLHSRMDVPDDWLVCNGILLPSNYVDVKRFEMIYRSCNCFRVFMSSGRNRDEPIMKRIAEVRGISLDYLEARGLCAEACREKFGFKDVRRLNGEQRISLAWELRKNHNLPLRQLSVMVHLKESELRKYVR